MLVDGTVLLVGGSRAPDTHLYNVDLFDPDTNTISPVAPINTPRHDHTATLLDDGRVLVVGGYTLPQKWLADAEIYDPFTDTWTSVPPHYSHGTGHSATLLDDGRVLVVGGCTGSSLCTERVEIFDPQTDTWENAASLASGLANQTAQLLRDGRVLVIGGAGADGTNPGSGALIYDPSRNTWTETGPMIHQRSAAESILLPNGQILVVGGLSMGSQPSPINSAEIFDQDTKTWKPAAALSRARYAFQLVAFAEDQILAIGGASAYESNWSDSTFVVEIESYDPATNRWHIAGLLPRAGAFSASVLLLDGKIWLTGGRNQTTYYPETWLIDAAE